MPKFNRCYASNLTTDMVFPPSMDDSSAYTPARPLYFVWGTRLTPAKLAVTADGLTLILLPIWSRMHADISH